MLVIIAILLFLPDKIGVWVTPGTEVLLNPVLNSYIPLIILSILLGIALDVITLWRGKWETSTRLAKIGANLFGLYVLFVLISAHNTWLVEQGVGGFFSFLETLGEGILDAEATLILGMAALILARPAAADTVILTSGKPLRGGVHRDEPGEIAWNPYFSRHPGMVFDVQTVPRSKVKEVVYEEPEFQEFVRRRREGAGDVGALLELAAWCRERKLKEERTLVLLDALRLEPANEEALKAFGRSKFPKVRRGNPDFDEGARAAVDDYLGIADPEERKSAFGRLKREHGID